MQNADLRCHRVGRRASWTAAGVVALFSAIALAVHAHSVPASPPGWSALPPPRVLAAAFDATPTSVGTQVSDTLIPVSVWSGDSEQLNGPHVVVVAFDGTGSLVVGTGVAVAASTNPPLAALTVGHMQGLLTAWRAGPGWVAVVVWDATSADTAVVDRLVGLQRASGPLVPGV